MARHCWNCKRQYSDDKSFCEKDGNRLVMLEGYAGRTVGDRYRLEGLIGEGGFGQVYVAVLLKGMPEEGLSTASPVAVKLITRMGRKTDEWDKLKRSQRRETEVARKIRHEHLLRIYDSGEDRGTESLYIVMPLGARDLKTILADEGPGSSDYNPQRWLRRAILIGTQVCDALTALHDNKIYHRDVKPQNVMESSGRIMLIDYGIAKDLHPQSSMSQSSGDIVRGTAEYMCPDFFREDGSVVDYALADQYSFGVMMYELFAGDLPYHSPATVTGPARAFSIIEQHKHKAPPPLRANRPEVPNGLEQAVIRMLQKDPARRYPSMIDARQALVDGAEALEGASRPVGVGDADAPSIEISGVQVHVDKKTGQPRYILRF